MAKERPSNKGDDKPTGRARESGKTVVVNVELDKALDDVLEKFLQADRRTKRATITIAIEEYLTRHGFWPPKS